MRGRPDPQRGLPSIADLENRAPKDDPLRRIEDAPPAALARLLPTFDRICAGRAAPRRRRPADTAQRDGRRNSVSQRSCHPRRSSFKPYPSIWRHPFGGFGLG